MDVDANGIANIGDSLTVTISGSGVDASLQTAYVRFLSTLYGDVGQQNYNNIDATGFDLGNDDGGSGRPDWVMVTKSGSNFVKKVPIINDQAAEFAGQSVATNTLTIPLTWEVFLLHHPLCKGLTIRYLSLQQFKGGRQSQQRMQRRLLIQQTTLRLVLQLH